MNSHKPLFILMCVLCAQVIAADSTFASKKIVRDMSASALNAVTRAKSAAQSAFNMGRNVVGSVDVVGGVVKPVRSIIEGVVEPVKLASGSAVDVVGGVVEPVKNALGGVVDPVKSVVVGVVESVVGPNYAVDNAAVPVRVVCKYYGEGADALAAKISEHTGVDQALIREGTDIIVISGVSYVVIAYAAPVVIDSLGFGIEGIRAYSIASKIQNIFYKGKTRGLISIGQFLGTKGMSVNSKILPSILIAEGVQAFSNLNGEVVVEEHVSTKL